MSFSQSQDHLYKDKCLYIAMNVMLSKIQRLEKEVLQLKSQLSTKQSTDMIASMNKRINKLEMRDINCSENLNIDSALDEYLRDIDLVEDFQLQTLNDNTNTNSDNGNSIT